MIVKAGFSIGDIITGVGDNGYAITTSKATMEVVRISGNGMKVRITHHEEKAAQVGSEYDVTQRGFIHTDNVKAVKAQNDLLKREKEAVALVKKSKSLFRSCKEWTKGWAELMSHNSGGLQSTASYIVLKKDKTVFKIHSGGCHSSLRSEGTKDNKYVISWVRDSHEHKIPFLRWMIKKSPYSHFILNPSATDALRRGLVVHTDVPSNLLGQCMVVSRQMWEYPDIVNTWFELQDGGINPTLAFAIAHSFTYNKGNETFTKARRSSSHNAMDGVHNTRKGLINMLSGKPDNPNANYSDDSDYDGIFKLWSSKYTEDYSKYLTSVDFVQDIENKTKDWDGSTIVTKVTSKAQFIKNMKKIEADIMLGIKEKGQ